MLIDELIKKIEKTISKTKYCVLATANKNGIISASQMCLINEGLTLYFQTDNSFEKVKNIKENHNVSVNMGKMYFKGTAEIVGLAKNNETYIKKMKEKHFETYENYTNLNNQILIKVRLTECRIWDIYINNNEKREEVIQVIDLKNKVQKKIICEKLKEGF